MGPNSANEDARVDPPEKTAFGTPAGCPDRASAPGGRAVRPLLAEGRLPADLVAGVSVGTLAVIREISLAALVFSGALSPYVSAGVGLALASALVVRLLVALRSSYYGTLATLQDAPIAVVAVAAAIAASGDGSPRDKFLLVVALGFVTTALCGAVFLALGTFRLGHLVRFVPYPVIGGFLAGTGWLIVCGSVGVMTGTPLHWQTLGRLLEPAVLVRVLPGAALAAVLLVLTRYVRHFAVLPGVFLAAIGVFYVVLLAAGYPVRQARVDGWLFGPFPDGGLWQPYLLEAVRGADWRALVGQAGTVGSALVVSLLALLLNASGLELATRRDVDLNRELRVAGLANLGAALAGGLVGYQSCSMSVLAHQMGGRGRRVGLAAAGVTAAVLFLGPGFLTYLPKSILGGLLLYLGASILLRWLHAARPALPRGDYAILVLIVVAIGALGFLEGVGLGTLAAILLFVVRTSLVGVVKRESTGADCRSNVDRPPDHRRALQHEGARVHVLQLTGYLFFGTASRLLQQVRNRAADAARPALGYLVLDFRRVAGIDSSAVFSFVRMCQMAQEKGFAVVVTGLSDRIRLQMQKGGVREEPGGALRVFGDLDHGLEWVEDRLLERAGQGPACPAGDLRGKLNCFFEGQVNVDRLLKYLKREEVPRGGYLMRQGDPPDGMIFIESGQVTVLLELEGGRTVRLRTMQEGTVVGEVGWYLGQPRSASVVAETPTVIHRLSSEGAAAMSREDPAGASAFHAFMARLLAERLAEANRAVEGLSE